MKRSLLRVFVADDHALFRRGVKALLDQDLRPAVIGEAGTIEEAERRITSEKWDVLLLDISFPDGSGIDLLHNIRRRLPDLPVLIVSAHDEKQYAAPSLRAGATGYIMKDAVPEQVVEAIRTVLAGTTYVSQAVAETMADAVSGTRALHERLSKREYEVFCKLAGGQSVRDIADDLFLSSRTVSTFRARVLTKLTAKSN